jgi:hypothetical protein
MYGCKDGLTERNRPPCQAEDALKKLCKNFRMSQIFDSLSKRLKAIQEFKHSSRPAPN